MFKQGKTIYWVWGTRTKEDPKWGLTGKITAITGKEVYIFWENRSGELPYTWEWVEGYREHLILAPEQLLL